MRDCRSPAKTKVLVRIIQRTSQLFSNGGLGKPTEKPEHLSSPAYRGGCGLLRGAAQGWVRCRKSICRSLKPKQLDLWISMLPIPQKRTPKAFRTDEMKGAGWNATLRCQHQGKGGWWEKRTFQVEIATGGEQKRPPPKHRNRRSLGGGHNTTVALPHSLVISFC